MKIDKETKSLKASNVLWNLIFSQYITSLFVSCCSGPTATIPALPDDSNPHCQHHLYQRNQWWHAHLNCDPGRGSCRMDRKEHLLPPPAPPASSFFWAMGEEEVIWWRGGGWGRDGEWGCVCGGARCFPWGCLLERGDPACRSMTCEGDIMKCEWLSL